MYQIRWATGHDAPALGQVFYRSVREGDSPYTPAERAAWVPDVPDPQTWYSRLARVDAVLCEIRGDPVGFMTVEPGGYVDLAFILPDHRGSGLFRRMFDAVAARARNCGETRLTTHASLMAQPAFQAMGFHVIQHEVVERAGEQLRRTEMEKHLT